MDYATLILEIVGAILESKGVRTSLVVLYRLHPDLVSKGLGHPEVSGKVLHTQLVVDSLDKTSDLDIIVADVNCDLPSSLTGRRQACSDEQQTCSTRR